MTEKFNFPVQASQLASIAGDKTHIKFHYELEAKKTSIGWIGRFLGEGDHAKTSSILIITISLICLLPFSGLISFDSGIVNLIGVALGFYISNIVKK